MTEISEKTKQWLFGKMDDSKADMHEARQGYEWQQASEKYGMFVEIVAGLGLMDEYFNRGE